MVSRKSSVYWSSAVQAVPQPAPRTRRYEVELLGPEQLANYGRACGWTLARAHARSGASAQISGYLGKSDSFDKAIAAFSIAYADQNERDHAELKKAIRSGRVEAVMEPG